MNEAPPPEHLHALLSTDRELSDDERLALEGLADINWKAFYQEVREHARAVYGVVSAVDFAECVREHLNPGEREVLRTASVYTCPRCQRLLKDRRTPVAAAIELERARIRVLYQAVETATDAEREAALTTLRKAIGIE